MKIGLVIIIAIVCSSCCLDVITPVQMTHSAIIETFVRMHLYAQQRHSIPTSLDVLPKRTGYANRTTDGWNRPLLFETSADGILTLKSFGKDGKPGGKGEDADISTSYYAKHENGTLWIGDEMWIVEALTKVDSSQPGDTPNTHSPEEK
ncbi:MAG: type II secretion system protein GspG [bacterium]